MTWHLDMRQIVRVRVWVLKPNHIWAKRLSFRKQNNEIRFKPHGIDHHDLYRQ